MAIPASSVKAGDCHCKKTTTEARPWRLRDCGIMRVMKAVVRRLIGALIVAIGLGQVVLDGCLLVCHRPATRAVSMPAASACHHTASRSTPRSGFEGVPRACGHDHQASRALLPVMASTVRPLGPLNPPAVIAAVSSAPERTRATHAQRLPDTSPGLTASSSHGVALRI